MTGLRSALERYVSMRHGLGYKYHHQERRLADFVSFMEKRKTTTITTKLAVAWATLPPDRHASWALRLTNVRGFARHVANIDPETEVPPAEILPPLKRAKPYLYSDVEINALLSAALSFAACKRTATMDLPLSVRVDRGDRHASVGGDRASARRRRSWSGRRYVAALVRIRLHEPEYCRKLASTSSESAVVAVLAPVCTDKFRALPDVVARTATLIADKDNSYKMREAFPEVLITLPGKSFPDSDLTAACARLILAPPKTADLR
jgi:hypothetical protein